MVCWLLRQCLLRSGLKAARGVQAVVHPGSPPEARPGVARRRGVCDLLHRRQSDLWRWFQRPCGSSCAGSNARQAAEVQLARFSANTAAAAAGSACSACEVFSGVLLHMVVRLSFPICAPRSGPGQDACMLQHEPFHVDDPSLISSAARAGKHMRNALPWQSATWGGDALSSWRASGRT